MTLRGHVNGLAARPQDIYRPMGDEQRQRARNGGALSGRQRAAQARADAIEAALVALKTQPFPEVLHALYVRGYDTGYNKALQQRRRGSPTTPATESAA